MAFVDSSGFSGVTQRDLQDVLRALRELSGRIETLEEKVQLLYEVRDREHGGRGN